MNTRLTGFVLTASLGFAALASLSAAHAGDWEDVVSARSALLNDPQVVAGSVMAGQWTMPVSGKTTVSGNPQTVDRSTDWAKAVGAKENVRGSAQATSREPYGFLAQAVRQGLAISTEEVAAK